MPTIITESKPVKHSKKLNGKTVWLYNKERKSSFMATYHYVARRDKFGFEPHPTRGILVRMKKDYDVELVTERIE